MNKRSTRALIVLAVLLLAVGAWAYWSGRGLITLNVRNADVLDVVKKIERQARVTIVCDSNVQGKVTFKVRRARLETVLTILDDQISARWSALYPLYSSSKSFTAFQRSLRGEIDPTQNGWTNLQSRSFFGGFGGRGGGPGFGGPGFGGPGSTNNNLDPRDPNRRITLNLAGKDVQFAALAFGRFGMTRVVPEDGTDALISLNLEQAKIPDAIAKLAKQAHRDWAKIYLLQGSDRGREEFAFRDGGGRGDRGDRGDDGERRRRFDWGDMTDEQREQRRMERENLEKELTATLPAAEQARIAEQRQQAEQMRQEFANMTDEQRRARFEQMRASGGPPGGFGGNRDQRALDRIKNTTPEQKVERMRLMAERRARWEARGGGGPGRGR